MKTASGDGILWVYSHIGVDYRLLDIFVGTLIQLRDIQKNQYLRAQRCKKGSVTLLK